jgi:hypothetical protein
MGLFAGRYDEGVFSGDWHLRPSLNDLNGTLGGLYSAATEAEPDDGLFFGRYASKACRLLVKATPLSQQ